MNAVMSSEEYDGKGNPICGQDFMAGTICSDVPGHAGSHSATCQECGGNWINQDCTCYSCCQECGSMFEHGPSLYCEDCRCPTENPLHPWGEVRGDVMLQCVLFHAHVEDEAHHPHQFPPDPPCPLAECARHGKGPVTDEEVAEVFGLSLPLRRSTP